MIGYFRGSIVFTAVCLILSAVLGWTMTGSLAGTLGIVWITLVLGVLEISLSFDNAVVNATVLRGMNAIWRRRFLTWGIAIAVIGMRIVFPLAIVAIAARLGPVAAVVLAATQPAEYERIISGTHVGIAGFGGAFLAMVGLKFFFDERKEIHWIGAVERSMARLAGVRDRVRGRAWRSTASRRCCRSPRFTLIVAGIFGSDVYRRRGMGALLNAPKSARARPVGARRVSVSRSHRCIVLVRRRDRRLRALQQPLSSRWASGSAMFVRSLTVLLVDRGTLAQFRFLEHGAFWAILALAVIMLLGGSHSDTITDC